MRKFMPQPSRNLSRRSARRVRAPPPFCLPERLYPIRPTPLIARPPLPCAFPRTILPPSMPAPVIFPPAFHARLPQSRSLRRLPFLFPCAHLYRLFAGKG